MILKRSLASTGLTLIALTTLAACGEARPSVDELSSSIQESKDGKDMTGKQADCLAKVIYDSDLSDKTVKTMAVNPDSLDNASDLPAADQKIVKDPAFLNLFIACIKPETSDLPDVTLTDPATEPTDEVTPDPFLCDSAYSGNDVPEECAGAETEGENSFGADPGFESRY